MEQIQCSNCNSFKIKISNVQTRVTYLIIGIIMLSVAVLWMNSSRSFVGVIGFFLLLISVIPIISNVYFLIKKKGTAFKCKNCHFRWKN